jgi:hypothetical protein
MEQQQLDDIRTSVLASESCQLLTERMHCAIPVYGHQPTTSSHNINMFLILKSQISYLLLLLPMRHLALYIFVVFTQLLEKRVHSIDAKITKTLIDSLYFWYCR